MMDIPENAQSNSPRKLRVAGMAGLIAAGAVVGGVLAATGGASAATSSGSAGPSTTSAATTPAATTPAATNAAPAPTDRSATPVRGDEKAVSTTISATLTSRALAAVPGGTVFRVETDAGDATYEAHMTKADGTPVTVKFDASLNVTKVETGMGQGDPAPVGGPRQPGAAA
jgi:hypothetical protein